MDVAALILFFVTVVYGQNFQAIIDREIGHQFRQFRPGGSQQSRPQVQSRPSRPRPFTSIQPARQSLRSNVDEQFGGKDYNFSWKHDSSKWDWNGAIAYCRRLGAGWQGISINSVDEDQFVDRKLEGDFVKYIWTSGHRTASGNFRWYSGAFVAIDWSPTGGFRRPQPDNRERDVGENCLSVLNKFYTDERRPHWHDVACYHVKPIICEREA